MREGFWRLLLAIAIGFVLHGYHAPRRAIPVGRHGRIYRRDRRAHILRMLPKIRGFVVDGPRASLEQLGLRAVSRAEARAFGQERR
jgi:hypothetical protein